MKKISKGILIPIFIIVYSFILFGIGLLPDPQLIYPLGFILGMITFYIVYYIPERKAFLLDIYLFMIAILGGIFGSALLWISCQFFVAKVCQAALFDAQVFGNVTFPLLIIFFLWLAGRLSKILRRK
jgi:hypothetical protein